mmetsp:Transcript_55010/g.128660  ORF Transcript_55010/g.128660 Transcript_55010/m.128660 type:complete len:520 (-) Transcript_55010:194-1753(-)
MASLSSKGHLPVTAPQHVHMQDRRGVRMHAHKSYHAPTTTAARVSSGSSAPNAGLFVLSALTAAPTALARRSRRQVAQRCKTGVARKGVEDSGDEQRGQWEMISKVTTESNDLDGFIVPSQRKAQKNKGSSSSSTSTAARKSSRPVVEAAAPTSNGTHGPQAPVEQSSSSENPPKGTSADAAASGGGGWWKPVAGGQAAATQSQRSPDMKREVGDSDFAENAGTALMVKGVKVKMATSPTIADAQDNIDDADEDELASFINPSVRSGREGSRKRRPTRRPRASSQPANGVKRIPQELAAKPIPPETQPPASEPSSSSNAPAPGGWWRPVTGGYGRAAKSQRTLSLEKEISIADFVDNVDPLIIQADSRQNADMKMPAKSFVEPATQPIEPQESEEAAAAQPAESDGLPNLLAMTASQRADLVDEHTREAMKLLEDGNQKEAMAAFDRLNRIVKLFQKVAQLEEDIATKAKSPQDKLAKEVHQGDVDEIYLRWRQELHEDDFSEIFGSKAWNSRWIGGLM